MISRMRLFFVAATAALVTAAAAIAAAPQLASQPTMNLLPRAPFSQPVAIAWDVAFAAKAAASGWSWSCLGTSDSYLCGFYNNNEPAARRKGSYGLSPTVSADGCSNAINVTACIKAVTTTCSYNLSYFDGQSLKTQQHLVINVCKPGWAKQAMALDVSAP